MVGVAAGVISGIATKVLLLLWAVKDMTTNSVISPQAYIAKKLFVSCSASFKWLLKLAYRISFGLIERQLGYDLEKFDLSPITTCLPLSRKENLDIATIC